MYKSLCLVVLVVFVRSAIGELSDEDRAVAQQAFYSGEELRLTPKQKAGLRSRVAISDNTRRWPNGTIPYVIDPSLSGITGMIQQAAEHIRSQTGNCIKFVPRSNQPKYVRMFSGNGCYSSLGMSGSGAQDLSLGGRGCAFIGTVIHEMLHAVGFDHEQNRPDRDNFLVINRGNIQQGMEYNFDKTPGGQTFNDFDYDSIMIYGEYAFSKQPGVLKTMYDRNNRKKVTDPYDKKGMTSFDAYQIKRFYGCP